jgi:DNA (cytosine-5)-methyltransferase 1
MYSKYFTKDAWIKLPRFGSPPLDTISKDTLFSYYEERDQKNEIEKVADAKIRIATVFSGIGAPEEALRQLDIDHEIVFACDIDKHAKISYEMLHGKVENFYTNIKAIVKRDEHGIAPSHSYTGKVDLFVGGSPCPSFSSLGKKEGFEDERGQLFFDYIQLVKDIKPTIFIFENVRGFISKDVFSHSKKEFVDLQSDYEYMISNQDLNYWDGVENILNAKYYGLSQSRSRFYLVGVLKNKKKDNFPKTPPSKIELQRTIGSYLDPHHTNKEFKTLKPIYFILSRFIRSYNSLFLEDHLNDRNQVIQCQTKKQQQNLIGNFYFKRTADLSLAHKIKLCKKNDNYYFYHPITEQDNVLPLEDSETIYAVLCNLTADECFKLMGFETLLTDKTPFTNKETLYGQAGNSMAVPVLKAIYKHIGITQYSS